ncbi:hypothetical protein L4D00_15210 [Photobacterium swingsii]|uniref:hypothetical protein n=1 Tax=Photobacterium swingsii TaxID=680026 RepID=UPI00352E8BB3
MDNLFTYIAAIKGHSSDVVITNQATHSHQYIDDGVEVNEEQTSYVFNNGVVIQYHSEKDSIDGIAGHAADNVCEECWISYQVLESGVYAIRPMKKVFNNKCQEAFWVKIQREQQLAH